MREAPPLPEEQQYDSRKVYAAHRQAILQNSPETEHSPSKLDALIAMHMREEGFKREDIEEAIRHCAPEVQPEQEEDRNWQRYAEHVVEYAFGVPGDLWLARREEERKREKREPEVQQEAISYETPRKVPRMRLGNRNYPNRF